MNKHEKVFIGILFRNYSENCSKWFNIERFDRKGKPGKYMSIKKLSSWVFSMETMSLRQKCPNVKIFKKKKEIAAKKIPFFLQRRGRVLPQGYCSIGGISGGELFAKLGVCNNF
jgi:hypothetical protein